MKMSEKIAEKKGDPTSPTVAFDYIKGNFFRVIHADGALAAPTPSGNLHCVLYSERPAIPRRLVHELKKGGVLGEIKETDSRNSIVREMDVDIVLTKEVTKALITCLQNALK